MADAPDHKTDSGLVFYIDGQYKMARNGNASWTTSGPWTISGSGPHTLKWRYAKDSSESSGSDCAWVDHIQWSGDMPDPNGWEEIAYLYDPAGRRIEKKVDGTTQVKYVYDGDSCIAEYDGSNNLLRKYIHGPCIDEPICMIEVGDANAVSYYHFDALGSVIALSNDSGDTEQVYEYSVYGQVAASDPNHPNRFLFTGREFDADTGLYYYRARYYHPEIGRFLQTDPIGYGDGMNMYAYCTNGPIVYVDPQGLSHDPYDLPWNKGAPVKVKVAFYDGGDPGFDANNDGVPEIANGAMFKEAADDFVYEKDGLTYFLYFDMNVTDPDKFIAETLTSLAQRGYEVTDLYFYDHSTTDENGDFALEFGSEVWGPAKVQAFARWINFRYPQALPANCSIHFRHCDVASEGNRDFFEDLASWFNRKVTGVAGHIHFTGPAVYDASAKEADGPEYEFGSDLWEARPGGRSKVIWKRIVPVGPGDPRLISNPVPHGY